YVSCIPRRGLRHRPNRRTIKRNIVIRIERNVPRIPGTARSRLKCGGECAKVLYQNRISFEDHIAAVPARTSFRDVRPDAGKGEIFKVLRPDNFDAVSFNVNTSILHTRRCITRYICFKDRRISDHRVLADDDINAATNLFYSICDGARTGDVGGNRRVVQDKLAATNQDGAAAVSTDVYN